MNDNFDEELNAKVEYEFSHKYNHTLHAYIDIAGDLVSGTLLSQIMYWFSESKTTNKLRVKVFKDGKYWLAKQRSDWYEEIRITERQYDTAIKKLENKGFVELKKYKFNSLPTIHIRPIFKNINDAVNTWKKTIKQNLISGSVKPITEALNGNHQNVNSLGNYENSKTGITNSVSPLTGNTNIDFNNRDYHTEITDINASAPDRTEGTPYLNMNNCTSDEIKSHYAIRCRRIAKKHNIADCQKIDGIVNTIEYFCRKYYETLGENHPVLSDRALERVFINFCFPPELLYEFGCEDFDAYKEMIDRYFMTEYGKYQMSGGTSDYSISHFMSEQILINLCKNVFGIPHL